MANFLLGDCRGSLNPPAASPRSNSCLGARSRKDTPDQDAYGTGITRVRQSLNRLQSIVDHQHERLIANLELRVPSGQSVPAEALRKSHDGLKALSEQYIEESKQQLDMVNTAIDELLIGLSDENTHLKETAIEKELRFRRIFQVTTVGISLISLDWSFRDANDAFLNLLGYTREDLLDGRIRWSDLTPPDFRQFDEWVVREIMETGICAPYEKEFVSKDGTRIPVFVGGSLVSTGGNQQILFSVVNLLERRRSYRMLKLAEFSLDRVGDSILWIDREGKIAHSGRAASELLGYTREEFSSIRIGDVDRTIDADKWASCWESARRKGQIVFESTYRTKMGADVPVEVAAWHLEYDSQEFVQIFARDITERAAARELLRESEQRYRDFINDSSEGVCCFAFNEPIPVGLGVDEQIERLLHSGRLIECNSTMARQWGISAPAEVLGRPPASLLMEIDPATVEHLRRLIRSGYRLPDYDTRGTDCYGRARVFRTSLVATVRNDCICYLWQRRADVTQQHEAHRRIQEQAALLNQAGEAIIVLGLDRRVVFWNRAAEKIYGWSATAVAGRDVREFFIPGGDQQTFDEAWGRLGSTGDWSGEWEINTPSGARLTIDSRWTMVRDESGDRQAILMIDADVTEKRELEARFLRAQRVESLGLLAAGIAHDMNNVLSPILLAIEALRRQVSSEDGQYLLALLKLNTERGAALINQVLSFAKGPSGGRTDLQLRYLIQEMVGILTQTLPGTIKIRTTLQDDLWLLEADATQLNQVLVNLCLNARDAMPGGGVLTISAENVLLTGTQGPHRGRFVAVSVGDTGGGIDPEIRDKIFEPFFSTKAAGRGTGLGLSTAVSIVESHGGFMDVANPPGSGTEFHIYLPARHEDEEETKGNSGLGRQWPELPRGRGETILVVDQDPTILSIMSEQLRQFCYEVLVADSAATARHHLQTSFEKVFAIVLDMAVPAPTGHEPLEGLWRLKPKLKLILMTSLNTNQRALDELKQRERIDVVLRKPFLLGELLTALAALRDA